MEIERNRVKETVCLFHKQYLQKVLNKFGINKYAKSVTILLVPQFKLSSYLSLYTDEKWEFIARILYASATGSFMYAMVYLRPDISHANR